MTSVLKITGMSCQNCVGHVGEALLNVAGVESVEVELEAGTARVDGDGLEAETLIEAVRGAGYGAEVVGG